MNRWLFMNLSNYTVHSTIDYRGCILPGIGNTCMSLYISLKHSAPTDQYLWNVSIECTKMERLRLNLVFMTVAILIVLLSCTTDLHFQYDFYISGNIYRYQHEPILNFSLFCRLNRYKKFYTQQYITSRNHFLSGSALALSKCIYIRAALNLFC